MTKFNKYGKWLAILLIVIAIIALLSQTVFSQSGVIFNEKDSTYQISETETEILATGWTRTTVMISPSYPDSLLAFSIEQKADELFASLERQNEQLQADSIEFQKQSEALKSRTGKDYNERIADYLNKKFEGDWVLHEGENKIDLNFKNGKFRQKGDENYAIKALSKTSFLLQKITKNGIYFEEKEIGKWVGKSDESRYVLKK